MKVAFSLVLALAVGISSALSGPWALQQVPKGSEVLSFVSDIEISERLSTWPGRGLPSWIPGTPYVYDNNVSNVGGIVPSGGLTIDGLFVKAGTWVAQFRDLSAASMIIEGDVDGSAAAWPGVLFRGCRMRGLWSAPGWFNQNGGSPGGHINIHYCDAGGTTTSLNSSLMCESIFESSGRSNGGRDTDKLYLKRNYLSRATTLVFLRNDGDAAIENFGHEVLDFGDSTKHLNGIANGGGENGTLWLRNNLIFSPIAGSTVINDVIQMAADNGPYIGGYMNLNGKQGYQIIDNFLAGAQYTLQLGCDKANTEFDVRMVVVTGNIWTTSVYSAGGSTGVAYKGPHWGLYGNTWLNNTWADGPNAGQIIPCSSVAQGFLGPAPTVCASSSPVQPALSPANPQASTSPATPSPLANPAPQPSLAMSSSSLSSPPPSPSISPTPQITFSAPQEPPSLIYAPSPPTSKPSSTISSKYPSPLSSSVPDTSFGLSVLYIASDLLLLCLAMSVAIL